MEGPEKFWHLHEDDATEAVEKAWLAPDNDTGAFLHALRESLRMEQWSEVSYRRRSYKGAEGGVDRNACLELHKQLSGLERYKLRTILCGAINTHSRMARILDIDPICKCCSQGCSETPEHVFLECPAHSHLRHTDLTETEWESLPNCLKLQGIVPKNNELIPERFRSPIDRKVLGCTVQHNLLDMWDHRNALTGAAPPVPRWSTESRLANTNSFHRAVRRRIEEPAEICFQAGGHLVTGEGWRDAV